MESCKIPVMERKQQCPSSHFFPTLPNQEVEKASGDDDTYAPLSGKKPQLSHHDMCVREWSEGCFCRGDQIVSILFVKIRSDSMPSLKAISTKKALLVQIGLSKKRPKSDKGNGEKATLLDLALRKATSCLHVLTPLDLLSQLLVDTKKFGLEWLVLIMHFLFSIFCLYIWEIASVFRVSIFSKGQKLKKAFCLFLRSCLSNLLSIHPLNNTEKKPFSSDDCKKCSSLINTSIEGAGPVAKNVWLFSNDSCFQVNKEHKIFISLFWKEPFVLK